MRWGSTRTSSSCLTKWETAPAFISRERAAILWGDRIARRLARRDGAAYRLVQAEFDGVEIVELTMIVSLTAMAARITNALRIAPRRTDRTHPREWAGPR